MEDSDHEQELKRLHKKMFVDLDMLIANESQEYLHFQEMTKALLPKGEVSRCNNIVKLLNMLETAGKLGIDNYAVLKQLLLDIGHVEAQQLVTHVEEKIKEIKAGDARATIDVTRPRSIEVSMVTGKSPTKTVDKTDHAIPKPESLKNSPTEQLTVQPAASKHGQRRYTRRELESLREVTPVLTPEGVTGIALLTERIVFVCAGGKLYRLCEDTWTDISESHNTEGMAWDVCVNDNTLVVSKGDDHVYRELPVQLIMCGVTEAHPTTVTLPFCSNMPTIECGRPVNGQPTFYVIETSTTRHCVHYMDCKGNILQTYGQGELQNPVCLTANAGGEVIVTDYGLNDVIVFNRDGSVKRRLMQQNRLRSRQNDLFGPFGVWVDEDGFIFVSAYDTHDLLSFSIDGEYIRTVLTEKDGIQYPTRLTGLRHEYVAICIFVYASKIKAYTYARSE